MSEFWSASLADTVKNSELLISNRQRLDDVKQWLNLYSENFPTSSNQGTTQLPFQRWFHFKEAFSPKFVTDTLGALPYRVHSCVDPFGGSGTTALTARMLGVASTSIEINPFLADLIEAKITPVTASSFCRNYESLIENLAISAEDHRLVDGMPASMTEPGIKGRYVFPADVFATIRAIVKATSKLPTQEARLLKVLLGAVLVPNSNVLINGKGRRYRKAWSDKQRTAADLIDSLDLAVDNAAKDLTTYAGLPRGNHRVLRGDSRRELTKIIAADVAIFSPPYPNSFDYTDVYNLELWMLGYLRSVSDNRTLRGNTLRSHVQTKWHVSTPAFKSERLLDVLENLRQARSELWNPNIPEMVGFYFDDLFEVFTQLQRLLPLGHHAVVAIGDSQYAGIHINVAEILAEAVSGIGFKLSQQGAIRSMRSSSQHGGKFDLSEHCLVFERIS
ncbi:DNA methylase N-4/N-6 [Rhizobium rhizogenes]|uniref:DNA methylase N-4/N-6 n=1 Tax=Rhizobium rhizogenes TaxID=359 RepID=UPI0012958C54|nr:DNA methylase N-4/N-6 [Rhizobium rhizogenes]MQB35120.1 DNA methylase N-4/N-6 [Rhizobium rhizogenes]